MCGIDAGQRGCAVPAVVVHEGPKLAASNSWHMMRGCSMYVLSAAQPRLKEKVESSKRDKGTAPNLQVLLQWQLRQSELAHKHTLTGEYKQLSADTHIVLQHLCTQCSNPLHRVATLP